MGEWAAAPALGLGNCEASNSLTMGNCGPALNANCTATWVENVHGLRLADDYGVCRNGSEVGMRSDTTYCPVLKDLDDDQFAQCFALWSQFTRGYTVTGPSVNLRSDGYTPEMPIKYSRAAGSVLYAYDLDDNDAYVSLIKSTRKVCDETSPRCWMSGIAYDYWEQYLGIRTWLTLLILYAVLAGFAVSFLFLFAELSVGGENRDKHWTAKARVAGIGASIISSITVLSVFTVVGIASLAGVKLCGFSAMSYVMAVGFAVEYSVHVTHRYLVSPAGIATASERIDYAMAMLFRPTLMAFISSAVGIFMLAASTFVFVQVYFFYPLLIVLFVTYFHGVFTLPAMLQLIDHESMRLHPQTKSQAESSPSAEQQQAGTPQVELTELATAESVDVTRDTDTV